MSLLKHKFHQIDTQINQTYSATTRLSKPHLKSFQSCVQHSWTFWQHKLKHSQTSLAHSCRTCNKNCYPQKNITLQIQPGTAYI